MSSVQRIPRDQASGEEGGSQAVKAQQRLRELILTGQLAAGERIAELTLVDLLGVSRTPIRTALMRLEQEGLLEALPSGGYAVRTFSEREVADAIELRGTLEGLAARLSAERGVPARTLAQAHACLDELDRLLLDPSLSDDMFSEYVRLNALFHRLLAEMPGSGVLAREIERAGSLPFASPWVLSACRSTTRQPATCWSSRSTSIARCSMRSNGARPDAPKPWCASIRALRGTTCSWPCANLEGLTCPACN